jgi:hypothetical protein
LSDGPHGSRTLSTAVPPSVCLSTITKPRLRQQSTLDQRSWMHLHASYCHSSSDTLLPRSSSVSADRHVGVATLPSSVLFRTKSLFFLKAVYIGSHPAVGRTYFSLMFLVGSCLLSILHQQTAKSVKDV